MASFDPSTRRSNLPVLPLRDVVVFPHMVIPLFVGRDKSIRALDLAMEADKRILLVAQKSAETDDPGAGDLYQVGTLAQVLQLLKLPDGTIKVLVEGVARVNVHRRHRARRRADRPGRDRRAGQRSRGTRDRGGRTLADGPVRAVRQDQPQAAAGADADAVRHRRAGPPGRHHRRAPGRAHRRQAEAARNARHRRAPGTAGRPGRRRNRRAAAGKAHPRPRQVADGEEPARVLPQRADEGDPEGARRDRRRAQRHRRARPARSPKPACPSRVEAKAKAELNKLKQMSPMSAEAAVVRNYLDWLLGVPWKKRTKMRKDLKAAQDVLDADHFGLEKVKERILEYLAVQSRVKQDEGRRSCAWSARRAWARPRWASRSPRRRTASSCAWRWAACATRPRSVATAAPTSVRCRAASCRTSTRSAARTRCSCSTRSTRCRWTSAATRRRRCSKCSIPEQNHAFNDHYLEVDLDLSEVMFVATSNSLNIPGPLLDRMEVIRIPGYTEEEKLNIAMRYLLPKQIKGNGLKAGGVEGGRERGARHRALLHARIGRALARARDRQDLPQGGQGNRARRTCEEGREERASVNVTSKNLDKYLGVRRFDFGRAEEQNEIGLVTGLAWTEVGGDLLQIEVHAGSGQGAAVADRPAGRRDEGIGVGCAVGRARPHRATRHRPGFPAEARRARARARRRHAEGRPERRHRDGDRAGVDADAQSGARPTWR